MFGNYGDSFFLSFFIDCQEFLNLGDYLCFFKNDFLIRLWFFFNGIKFQMSVDISFIYFLVKILEELLIGICGIYRMIGKGRSIYG